MAEPPPAGATFLKALPRGGVRGSAALARRSARPGARAGWAVARLCSPYGAFVTGRALVVDGANWLRRDFVMPEFTPVGGQLAQVVRPTG
jgi:hypothetical protein